MLRLARSSHWVGGLLLAIVAAIVCALLGRWQWDRSQGGGGDLQNLAYAFNWWLFSALCLWFWFKALRDEARRLADPEAGEIGTAGLSHAVSAWSGATSGRTPLPTPELDSEDAEVDEWNAWLAELGSRGPAARPVTAPQRSSRLTTPAPPPAVDWPWRVYRVIAFTVGVFLPILLGGAIYGLATRHGETIRVAAGRPTVVEIIGPIHGFLYIGLLLTVVTMALRERWNIVFTVLVGLSGTVPFLSFVAERAVTRRIRARRAAEPPVAHRPGGASRRPTAR